MNRCHASSDSLQSENPLSTVSTLAPFAEFFPYPSRRITIASEYGLTGVFLCAEKVERNIILITENPAIVPRRDVKQIAGSHFDN